MSIDVLIAIVISLLSGGSAVAIIQSIVHRKKEKTEITDINVKTALEIQEIAVKRYQEIRDDIKVAKDALSHAESKLKLQENYIKVLTDILDNHDIEIPEMGKGGKVANTKLNVK